MWIRSDRVPNRRRDDGPLLAALVVCLGVVFAMFKPSLFPNSENVPTAEEFRTPAFEDVSWGPGELPLVVDLLGPAPSPLEAAFAVSSESALKGTIDDYRSELNCLTQAIYYEARGENASGLLAVADVVLNRVIDPFYPRSICAVVYQGPLDGRGDKGCQFTFTCDGSLGPIHDERAWRKAEKFAEFVLMGFGRNVTNKATHYHADYVSPVWATQLTRTVQIGRHIFYKRTTG